MSYFIQIQLYSDLKLPDDKLINNSVQSAIFPQNVFIGEKFMYIRYFDDFLSMFRSLHCDKYHKQRVIISNCGQDHPQTEEIITIMHETYECLMESSKLFYIVKVWLNCNLDNMITYLEKLDESKSMIITGGLFGCNILINLLTRQNRITSMECDGLLHHYNQCVMLFMAHPKMLRMKKVLIIPTNKNVCTSDNNMLDIEIDEWVINMPFDRNLRLFMFCQLPPQYEGFSEIATTQNDDPVNLVHSSALRLDQDFPEESVLNLQQIVNFFFGKS